MNNIDKVMDLMSKDPTLLTDQDIEAIVLYHRNARGVKVVKEVGPRPSISDLITPLTPAKKESTFKRRI